MKHGISEQNWNDYLDGRMTGAARDHIEAHLIGCMDCWEFYEQLSCATQMLYEAGEEARQELTLGDKQLHLLLRGVFARLQDSETAASLHPQVQGRLNMLETVLAPFCGTQAALRALHAAAKDSPARTLERVTPDNWEPFMQKLTAIAAAMAGETFASLIWERGQF